MQDSNLRRQSHQIYSLTPLTARETPRWAWRDRTRVWWFARVSLVRRSLVGEGAAWFSVAARQAAGRGRLRAELAAGVEPTTC